MGEKQKRRNKKRRSRDYLSVNRKIRLNESTRNYVFSRIQEYKTEFNVDNNTILIAWEQCEDGSEFN